MTCPTTHHTPPYIIYIITSSLHCTAVLQRHEYTAVQPCLSPGLLLSLQLMLLEKTAHHDLQTDAIEPCVELVLQGPQHVHFDPEVRQTKHARNKNRIIDMRDGGVLYRDTFRTPQATPPYPLTGTAAEKPTAQRTKHKQRDCQQGLDCQQLT